MSNFLLPADRRRRLGVLVIAVALLTTSAVVAASSRAVRPLTPAPGAAPAATGPLDPLSVAEIDQTFQVIEAYGQFPRGAFFPYVSLKEPSKQSVLAGTSSRKALAQVYDRRQNLLVEATVDLAGRRVESWTPKPGVQPAV